MNRNLKNIYFFLAILLTASGMTGCAVGPKYKRPTVDVPVTYRDATAD